MLALALLFWVGPRGAEAEIGAELLLALAYWAGSGGMRKWIGQALALLEGLVRRRPSMVGGC
jgi:hypothetical protein